MFVGGLFICQNTAYHSEDNIQAIFKREGISILEYLLDHPPGDGFAALRYLHSLIYVPDLVVRKECVEFETYRRLCKDKTQ